MSETFSRWQQKAIDERSNLITLFIAIAFATIGFIANELIKPEFLFKNIWDKSFIAGGIIMLLFTTAKLLQLSINRFDGFSKTKDVVRERERCEEDNIPSNQRTELKKLRDESDEIDKKTVSLFKLCTWLIFISESIVILGIGFHICEKFVSCIHN